MKDKNLKIISLILLIAIVILSITTTWKIMDSKYPNSKVSNLFQNAQGMAASETNLNGEVSITILPAEGDSNE